MSGSRGRTNKITLGMMKGKSITTSVPSIAVRFHSGDEELDIYPSADDEDEDEARSSSSLASATVTSSSPPSNVAPSAQSRDPSPMKEYLRGLGKRSSSVDAGMMDVGSSGSDTWRIFHELKGKITKTVEEKLTEIKSDRRSVTPLFSGKSSPRHGRLRAGGNSQDNSSISDSEDISENSNKDDARTSLSNEAVPTICPQLQSQATQEGYVHFMEHEDETPSQSIDEPTIPESTKKKKKRDRKSGLRHRKSGEHIEMSSLLDEDSYSEFDDNCEEDIESGVEVSEETKFVPDTSIYGNIPTVDFRVSPPTLYKPSLVVKQRRANTAIMEVIQEPQSVLLLLKDLWSYHNLIMYILVFVLLFFVPLPSYIKGIIMGVLISMLYHLIVGIRNWYMPSEERGLSLLNPQMCKPTLPHYEEMPILEVPSHEEVETITKHGGWMNELTEEYDPDTYHINNTQSIYVRLDGSTLRISHPKSKIPKRALWNERKLKMKFIHQRIYDISDCSIQLLPEGITRKRRWSKKYPLCILLKKESKRRETSASNISDDQLKSVGQTSVTTLLSYADDEEMKPFDERASDEYLPSVDNIGLEVLNDEDNVSLLPRMDSLDHIIDNTETQEETLEMGEGSDEETFCMIDVPLAQETCLYLFSRTDRQKEDWYRRFVEAMKTPSNLRDGIIDEEPEVPVKPNKDYNMDDPNFNKEFVTRSALHNADMDYIAFMNKFHLEHNKRRKADRIAASLKLDREVNCDVMWINAFVGRILYDVLQNPVWIEKIQTKIQKKLTTIKLPYFVEELLLTGIELGRDAPMIHRASRPTLDDNGLWVDLDVTFEGSTVLTIETKINLMKLKKEVTPNPVDVTTEDNSAPLESDDAPAEKTTEKCKSPIYDSSVEDSAESSPTETDEEHGLSSSDDADADMPSNATQSSALSSNELSGSTTQLPTVLQSSAASTAAPEKKKVPVVAGKGVIKIMNKFVASQFFQSATENKYIKRAMEGVSNTQITLVVEIKAITGQLAVNFPPPPSDRLWYGFRKNPRLWISVKPKFGQRKVNFSYIISWLEKKLLQEFEKKFVLPNMDDLVIPPMTTDLPV